MASQKTIRTIPWKGKKKPEVMRGTPLAPNMAVADRYYGRLRRLIDKMSATVQKEIKELFDSEPAQEYFAQDASIASQARILTNALQKRFEDLFGFHAAGIADQFTDQSLKASAISLKSSLRELSQGLTLKTDILTGELNQALTAMVAENVGLIKSIPSEYLTQVRGAVMRSITTGRGLADLVPFLKNYEGVTLRRAQLIAHDQTRKVYSNINRVRMEKLGIKKFEWLHSTIRPSLMKRLASVVFRGI